MQETFNIMIADKLARAGLKTALHMPLHAAASIHAMGANVSPRNKPVTVFEHACVQYQTLTVFRARGVGNLMRKASLGWGI